VKLSSHGRKLKADKLTVLGEGANWLWDRVNGSSQAPFIQIGFVSINGALITAFSESWHKETINFHLPVWKMTVTLDDVVCILHIPIKRRPMEYDDCTYELGVELMTTLLGVPNDEAVVETSTH